MHNQWATFSSEKSADTKMASSVFKSKLGEAGIQFYIQFNLKEKKEGRKKNSIIIYTPSCFPNPTDDFPRQNTKGEIPKHVHAALFHTMKVNGDHSCQATIAKFSSKHLLKL